MHSDPPQLLCAIVKLNKLHITGEEAHLCKECICYVPIQTIETCG